MRTVVWTLKSFEENARRIGGAEAEIFTEPNSTLGNVNSDLLLVFLHAAQDGLVWMDDKLLPFVADDELRMFDLKDTIVFVGSCHGLENNAMLDALWRAGAEAIIAGDGVNFGGSHGRLAGADWLARGLRMLLEAGAPLDWAWRLARLPLMFSNDRTVRDALAYKLMKRRQKKKTFRLFEVIVVFLAMALSFFAGNSVELRPNEITSFQYPYPAPPTETFTPSPTPTPTDTPTPTPTGTLPTPTPTDTPTPTPTPTITPTPTETGTPTPILPEIPTPTPTVTPIPTFTPWYTPVGWKEFAATAAFATATACPFGCDPTPGASLAYEVYMPLVVKNYVDAYINNWTTEVRVNGVFVEAFTEAQSVVPAVGASDFVSLTDWLNIAHTQNVTFTMVMSWSGSLNLMGVVTTTGSIVTDSSNLTWTVGDFPTYTFAGLVTTWDVLSGSFTTDVISSAVDLEAGGITRRNVRFTYVP